MFSYKFYVREEKNGALMLRITNNRKKAEISMGLRLSVHDLESALSGKSNNIRFEKMLASWTAQIKEFMLELADAKEQDKEVKEICTILKERLLGIVPKVEEKSKQGNFVSYYIEHSNNYEKRSTRESNEYTLSVMRKYYKDLDAMNFEDVTYAWLSDFEVWMKKNNLSQNTRKIHFGNIRTAMREAYKRELTGADPFRRFSFRPAKTRKRSLDVAVLRSLINYPVEPFAEIYRDMFRLIFMLVGINSVDLHGLKSITRDGRIEYKRAKTGRLYSIKVEPEAREIINKYRGKNGLLCIADRWIDSRNFRHQCNKALQKIGQVERKGRGGKKTITAEFEGVSTYWARHTWATIAASLDIPKDTIAAALGHGGDTVTDIYIDFDQKKVDAANRRVLDWVLYGKR